MVNAEFEINLIKINSGGFLVNLFKFGKFILLKQNSEYNSFIRYSTFRFFLLIIIFWYFPFTGYEICWNFYIFRIKTYICEISFISSNLNFSFNFALVLLTLLLLILDFLIDIFLNFSLSYFFGVFKFGESVFRDIKIIFSIISSSLNRLNI